MRAVPTARWRSVRTIVQHWAAFEAQLMADPAFDETVRASRFAQERRQICNVQG